MAMKCSPVLSQRVKQGDGRDKRSPAGFAKAGNRFPIFRIILYECGMKVDGKPTRTIWLEADGWSVGIIDQTVLPHRFATLRLVTLDDMAHAIKAMQVRGAPLIGAAAAYGLCLALRADTSDAALERAYATLFAARPTAINLKWGLDEIRAAVAGLAGERRVAAAYARAAAICEEDVSINRAIRR